MTLTANMLAHRLEKWPTRNDMRLYAQGYMERVLGWVRPAANFTQLRAGWDTADADLRVAAQAQPQPSGNVLNAERAEASELSRDNFEDGVPNAPAKPEE